MTALDGRTITARRNIGNGWQLVSSKLPVLLTVTNSNEPRVAAAKKMMKYKTARSQAEVAEELKLQNSRADQETLNALVERRCKALEKKALLIKQWDLDFIKADTGWCGRNGSPTKVHKIQSVVLAAKQSRQIEPSDPGIARMIHELIEEKTIA